MRLDADLGDHGWTTLHVPSCKLLHRVKWVDDETAMYGIMHLITCFGVAIEVRKATRIVILPPKRLVLIDPVDDDFEADMNTNKKQEEANA